MQHHVVAENSTGRVDVIHRQPGAGHFRRTQESQITGDRQQSTNHQLAGGHRGHAAVGPPGEDVFVEGGVGSFASAVGGDAEAGCGGFAGFYEFVGSAHSVVVGVAAARDYVPAVGEAGALGACAGDVVDLCSDVHGVVGVGDQGCQGHDDDGVVGFRAVGVYAVQAAFVGAVQAVGERCDGGEVHRWFGAAHAGDDRGVGQFGADPADVPVHAVHVGGGGGSYASFVHGGQDGGRFLEADHHYGVGVDSGQLVDFGVEVVGAGSVGDERVDRSAQALEVVHERVGQALSVGLLPVDHCGDLVAFGGDQVGQDLALQQVGGARYGSTGRCRCRW